MIINITNEANRSMILDVVVDKTNISLGKALLEIRLALPVSEIETVEIDWEKKFQKVNFANTRRR